MYTLHNVKHIRRPEAVKSVNTAIIYIVFVYMIKFDKGAYVRTHFELIFQNYAVDRQPLFCSFSARAKTYQNNLVDKDEIISLIKMKSSEVIYNLNDLIDLQNMVSLDIF